LVACNNWNRDSYIVALNKEFNFTHFVCLVNAVEGLKLTAELITWSSIVQESKRHLPNLRPANPAVLSSRYVCGISA
jgi:hypothetical protein